MIRVVVVDDEAVARRGIVMGVDWAKLGCEIAGEAASGEEGVALVSRVAPDLIITDIRMPHMDGIEMMNELRKRGCRAHVIVLSAYSDFSYARSALKFGADDYLLKPFREGELENAVSGVLRRERAENPPETPRVPVKEGEKSLYVQEAMNAIARSYADPDLSITVIAGRLNVSEGHLSHLFKKETGYTIGGYLTQYRIHAAMALLEDCRNRVYEVAGHVGYRDVTYFGSTFKKLTGMSPTDYQNRGGLREGETDK